MVEDREAIDSGARVGPRYFSTGEAIDGSRRIAYARGTSKPGDAVSFQRISSSGTHVGTYPALAPVAETVLLAWTAGDTASSVIRVERVE